MPKQSLEKKHHIIYLGLPIALSVIGSFLLLYQYFFAWNEALPIQAEIFSEMIEIPLDIYNWGIERYSLDVENYLVFQNFETLLPTTQIPKTLAFGIITWLLISLGLSLISTFKRYHFIAAMAFLIFLLTISGVNALNIGGISSNLALIILLAGMAVPAMLINVFYDHISLIKRTLIISPIAIITLLGLILSSSATAPLLLMSENISLAGMAITAIFLLYIGHSLINGFFLLLTKLNQGIGLKISWHLTVFTVLYIGCLVFILLDLTGNLELPFHAPLFPLFLLAGSLGSLETQSKVKQINQPYSLPIIGKSLYWIGFGISTMVFWKAQFSANRPLIDFLEHWTVYTQMAFSLLFFMYLLANFTGFMNSGKPVADVIYRPKFFAYHHMRIGSIMALFSLIVFSDAIIGPQISTSSTNFSADYYYATDRPTEARILFENSWIRYRKNEKAKVATILLYLKENQSTIAKKHMEESLEWSPSVHEIILAANYAHHKNRYFDAVFYLQKGLEIFPDNSYLENNLALLLSKGNKAQDTYELISKAATKNQSARANMIGLQAKHLINYDDKTPHNNDLIAQINLMAMNNLRGDLAAFHLQADQSKDITVKQAILRNQWSNNPKKSLTEDLKLLEELEEGAKTTMDLKQLKISRVIRFYQSGQIGEALKHLNGLMLDDKSSAGYYHALAAKILIGQGDLEKSAKELVLAEEFGFRNFNSSLIPVLYYGKQRPKALEIAKKYDINAPDWLDLPTAEATPANVDMQYFQFLSELLKATKQDFLQKIETLPNNPMKPILAHEILLKKGHWLNKQEVNTLKDYLLQQNGIDEAYIQELSQTLLSDKYPASVSSPILAHSMAFQEDLTPNPYNAPFVLMKAAQTNDPEVQYELLRNAADFNPDPILWIEMIKTSEKIGLGNYGQAALEELSGWVDQQTVQNLRVQSQ
ncbi:hypothetical protein KZP23_11035 [Echinicola marina]|uniref:tetratricopeptide repeat protein n=1 Tax=Echinicola marina TaxID=2859768 RepID=UPI001CF6C38E|nr:hypothetical protein [Echinicola marina]UCS95500.1 hypothetical protein KZP23_11035 [Echinicola marina]